MSRSRKKDRLSVVLSWNHGGSRQRHSASRRARLTINFLGIILLVLSLISLFKELFSVP